MTVNRDVGTQTNGTPPGGIPTQKLSFGIEAIGISEVGRTREHNEDAYLLADPHPEAPGGARMPGAWKLVAVADGMGGHEAGEIASELALDVIEREMRDIELGVDQLGEDWRPELDAHLRHAVLAAHDEVRRHADENPERSGMGTTVAVAVFVRGWVGVGHVGDSRAFLVRDRGLDRLTVDHSWVEEQRTRGQLSSDEIAASPFRHTITRAVGATSQAEPDIAWRRLEPGDVVVLATDGLTRYADEPRLIEEISDGLHLTDSATRLVQFAEDAGGIDNITIVLVRFDGLVGITMPTPHK